jgi:hypothetical protein
VASRRSQILDAVVTALDAAGKPTGVTVSRTRANPLEDAELPAMVVARVQEIAPRGDGSRGYKAKRVLTVRVECRVVAATDGETLEDALDPLTSWAVVALMTDPTFGGLAVNTQETVTQWATADAHAVHGAAAVDFEITYITAAGNPDAA